ncbi:hypothetical protein DEO72_LG10g2477 [Vigna unguiculata]|uniref:Uncharacterized protein n=1 Tax=Vigna unguiculata TaxID=3917 RepID=A0A4D6NEV2_VIGUN|nr:hypothetical protein DEO72_LG10g2477 [Vigna unguiculata]
MVEWNDGARMQECNGMMVPRHRVQQNDDAMMWWYSSATMQRAIVTVFSEFGVSLRRLRPLSVVDGKDFVIHNVAL